METLTGREGPAESQPGVGIAGIPLCVDITTTPDNPRGKLPRSGVAASIVKGAVAGPPALHGQ